MYLLTYLLSHRSLEKLKGEIRRRPGLLSYCISPTSWLFLLSYPQADICMSLSNSYSVHSAGRRKDANGGSIWKDWFPPSPHTDNLLHIVCCMLRWISLDKDDVTL